MHFHGIVKFAEAIARWQSCKKQVSQRTFVMSECLLLIS